MWKVLESDRYPRSVINIGNVRLVALSALLAGTMVVAPTPSSADEIGSEFTDVVTVEGGLSFFGGRLLGPPQMSDNGRHVVYREGVDADTVRWLDRTTGTDIVIADGVAAGGPGISGDGQWVVFVDYGASAVRLWSASSSSIETLSEPGATFDVITPSISNDGAHVLWNEARGGQESVRIWNRSSGVVATYPGRDATISGDGSQFAYVPEGASGAVLVEIATGASTDIGFYGAISNDAGVVASPIGQPRGVRFTNVASGAETSVALVEDTQLNTPGQLLSGDGAFGFFNTNVALVPEDANTTLDPYRIDLATEELAVIATPSGGTLIDVSVDGRQGLLMTQTDTPGYELTVVNLAEPLPSVAVAAQELPQLTDQVRRLYQAFFLRPPDAGGLAFWADRRADGQSLAATAEQFAQSPEFVERYGDLTDAAFVDLIYVNVQGRPGEEEGRAFWTGQLAAGSSRGQVMTGFSESPEFITTTETAAPTDVKAASVWRLYQAYYLRQADQSGFDFWFREVIGGRDLASISTAFSEAPEFTELYGELTDDAFVEQVYQNVLDRSPDVDGLEFWRDQMRSGVSRGEVMLSFSESTEFVVATDSLPPI